MRKHNGMRPQDIAILLKIISIDSPWQLSTLSSSLFISISEISESLHRSRLAKLIDYNKKEVSKQNLLEFLQYGIRYVYPQEQGTLIRGVPTAHSHPDIKPIFISKFDYVWPDLNGSIIGLAIEPFYKMQPKAALEDPHFHKLLALVDVIRIGKVREVNYAIAELKRNIYNENTDRH
jgi:hypothetical protein